MAWSNYFSLFRTVKWFRVLDLPGDTHFSVANGLSEAIDVFRKYLDNKSTKEQEKHFSFRDHTFQFENFLTSAPKVLAQIFCGASIHRMKLVIYDFC